MSAPTWSYMRDLAVKASRGEIHSHALLEQISAFSDSETAAKLAEERERIAQAIEAAAVERDQQIADIAGSKIVRRSMTTDGMRRAARIARAES